MPLKVPKRYADVVEAFAAKKDGGWSYMGPDGWRVWPTDERWSNRHTPGALDPGDHYDDVGVRRMLGLASPRKARAVAAAERDEAMARVDGHTVDDAWRAWVWRWIAGLDVDAEFIGDDVWHAADAAGVETAARPARPRPGHEARSVRRLDRTDRHLPAEHPPPPVSRDGLAANVHTGARVDTHRSSPMTAVVAGEVGCAAHGPESWNWWCLSCNAASTTAYEVGRVLWWMASWGGLLVVEPITVNVAVAT